MMTVTRGVGRLCEVRYAEPLTQDQLTEFTLAIRNVVATADVPLVFCCDWRGVPRFEKSIADTVVWIMRRDNPKIAHNAILVAAGNAALHAQVERILAEAASPRRTMHDDVKALRRLLAPMLDLRERERLDAFLEEPPLGGAPGHRKK